MTNGDQHPHHKLSKGARFKLEGVVASVVVHIILLIGAASLTVLVIQGRQKMMFEGKEPPSVPAKKLEHAIRVKQMEKQVRKPQILQRMVSKTPSSVALPELPEMEVPDMKNMRDTIMPRSKAGSALGGLGGEGGGAGRGLTGGTGYSDAQFFGENVRTRAICILMDISASILAKGIMEDVRAEALKMLEALNPNTKFNLIVFVDGAQPFSPQMVYGTKANREAGIKWLNQEFDGRKMGNKRGYSGSTPEDAIKLAVEMGCDTMFVLTDDPPYIKRGDAETGVEIPEHQDNILDFAKNIESKYGRQVKINTIAYKPWSNAKGQRAIDFLKNLSRSTGGRFKHIKRKDE